MRLKKDVMSLDSSFKNVDCQEREKGKTRGCCGIKRRFLYIGESRTYFNLYEKALEREKEVEEKQ